MVEVVGPRRNTNVSQVYCSVISASHISFHSNVRITFSLWINLHMRTFFANKIFISIIVLLAT